MNERETTEVISEDELAGILSHFVRAYRIIEPLANKLFDLLGSDGGLLDASGYIYQGFAEITGEVHTDMNDSMILQMLECSDLSDAEIGKYLVEKLKDKGVRTA